MAHATNFYDGGAFPEYHVVQYPRGLGQTLPSTLLRHLTQLAAEQSTRLSPLVASGSGAAARGTNAPLWTGGAAVVIHGGSVAGSADAGAVTAVVAGELHSHGHSEAPEEVEERTQKAISAKLEKVLSESGVNAHSKVRCDDFSAVAVRRGQADRVLEVQAAKDRSMALVLPSRMGEAGDNDPSPILRSPTKKRAPSGFGRGGVTEKAVAASTSSQASALSSAMTLFGGEVESTTGVTGDGLAQPSTSAGDDLSTVSRVPFCISNWKNKKKLVISAEQRLALSGAAASAGSSSTGRDGLQSPVIGSAIVDLATAMLKAKKEVLEEQAAKEASRREAEERIQMEKEREIAEQAQELLRQNAAKMVMESTERSSLRESREGRLLRLKHERELREREKAFEVRRRRLQRTAARLGMTVEALENDAELLKKIEQTLVAENDGGSLQLEDERLSASGTAPGPAAAIGGPIFGGLSSGSYAAGTPGETKAGSTRPGDDEDEVGQEQNRVRRGVFGDAVLSNEGIRREMEALERHEVASRIPQDGETGVSAATAPSGGKDSIQLALERADREEALGRRGRDVDNDDDGAADGEEAESLFGVASVMKKRKRFRM